MGALRGDAAARRAVLDAGPVGMTTTLNAAELLEGAALSQRPERERAVVEEFLQHLRLVPFGPRAARMYGPLAAQLWVRGEYPGLMDTLVASIALTEPAVLVTRNRKHFDKVPDLVVESW